MDIRPGSENFFEKALLAPPAEIDPVRAADFARRLYRDSLGRPATDAELDAMTSRLVRGESRRDVVLALLRSDEGRRRAAHQLFREYIGSEPSADSLRFFARWLSTASRSEEVLGGLLGSPDFALRWGFTHESFIQSLYDLVLRRSPSQAELSCWVGILDARNTTRYGVAHAFVTTDEYRDRRITEWFRLFLRREPERDEMTFWLSELRNDRALDDVLLEILSSDEYWELRLDPAPLA